MLESLESCSWHQALPILSMAAFGSVCLAAGVLLSRRGSPCAGPAPGKPLGQAAICEAATPVADKPASETPAAHPRRRRRGRGLRRDDSAHHPAAEAANLNGAPAAGNREAGPLSAPEAAAAATSSTEAWLPVTPQATAAVANSREAGAPTALEAAADSTDDGAPEAPGAAVAAGSTDARASAAPEATAAAAGSIDIGPPAAPEATLAGSNSLLPPSDHWTTSAAANDIASTACTTPDTPQKAALDPGQPQKDTAGSAGVQHQPCTSLTGCGVGEQADRLPSMELAHNLLNTGGSEALLTSGESEHWDAQLHMGQGRSRDSSLDVAWEALLGLTVNSAPRDSLDEQYAPQEAAGRRLNGGMMFPAEGDAFPDEPRLGALATVRRSLDQVGASCADCFFLCFLYLRQLDHTCLMGHTSGVHWSATNAWQLLRCIWGNVRLAGHDRQFLVQ